MLLLDITEEVLGGVPRTFPVRLPSERTLLSELIERTVLSQLNYESGAPIRERPHFFLSPDERRINAHVLKGVPTDSVDQERATYEALAAFQRNAFFVIVDGKQRSDLEEELLLRADSEVRFVRLTPLIGG